MADIPKDVFDYAIQSQIATGRHANKVVHDILALLNSADAEILAKLEKWGDSGRFTPTRLKALLAELRKLNAETYAQAHNEMKSGLLSFSEHVASETVGLISTQLPVDFNLVGMTTEQLTAIIDTAPIKVGPKGAMLLEETFDALANGKIDAIRGAIRLGMVEGEGMPEITRRLKGTRAAQYKDGILEGSRRDMEKIVRSVVQNTNNRAMQSTLQANAKVLNGWVYCGTLDGKMCSYCSVNYGKQFPLGEGPLPILHISCRCFQIPAIKTFKELGIDLPEFDEGMKASKNGPVKASMTYQEWLKSQDKATQTAILGPNRQKLFESGGLTFDKFVDDKGKFITLDQLKEKNKAVFKKVFG